VVVRSEGGTVEVDSSNMTMTKSLKKRTEAAHSEARVEAVACSEAGIEDDRWRRGDFYGNNRARESVRLKIC
jgi:hypothetical protein